MTFTLITQRLGFENESQKYYQIKKQNFHYHQGLRNKELLQIIDISTGVLFNRANAEKKLLALINATVSHEMRNPLNSIYS